MAKLPAPTVAHDDAYEIGCCVMDIVRCSASICTAQHFARKSGPTGACRSIRSLHKKKATGKTVLNR